MQRRRVQRKKCIFFNCFLDSELAKIGFILQKHPAGDKNFHVSFHFKIISHRMNYKKYEIKETTNVNEKKKADNKIRYQVIHCYSM